MYPEAEAASPPNQTVLRLPSRRLPPLAPQAPEQVTPAGGGSGGDGGRRLHRHEHGVRLSTHLALSLFQPSLVQVSRERRKLGLRRS